MAKGITSGYIPLGGLIVREEIIKHFDDKPLPIGLTYSAHAVACAAANAVIDIYKDEDLVTQRRTSWAATWTKRGASLRKSTRASAISATPVCWVASNW
jgi:adenosylmethionine-8-amino-7-oxononanoate aminotransferase